VRSLRVRRRRMPVLAHKEPVPPERRSLSAAHESY
jgi:hypothetical protein